MRNWYSRAAIRGDSVHAERWGSPAGDCPPWTERDGFYWTPVKPDAYYDWRRWTMRRRHSDKTAWVIVIGLCSVLLAVGGLIVAMNTGNGGSPKPEEKKPHAVQPEAKKEHPKVDTSTWTHKEILAHLKSVGHECVWTQSKYIHSLSKPRPTISLQRKSEYVKRWEGRSDAMWSLDDTIVWWDTNARCMLCDSAQEAREISGSMPEAKNWGRFVFWAGSLKEAEYLVSLLPKP